MQPEMLSPNEKELRALEEIRPSRDRVDERVFEENNEEVVDDNVRNLIIRLSSSTARGAFLANRLADIHRRIATGPSLSGNNENWFSNQAEEDEVAQGQVERPDWLKKKEKFQAMAQELKRAFEKFCNSPNRELVYNLYTYLWDIVNVVLMLVSYVDWLSMGRFSNKYKQLVIGRHTWFSGIREAFCSGDHEPWVFRGGLAADLQRLMPVDSGNDLFLYPYPDAPTSQIYTIRPFVPDSDTSACYSVALQTWDDGIDATQYFTPHPTLPGQDEGAVLAAGVVGLPIPPIDVCHRGAV